MLRSLQSLDRLEIDVSGRRVSNAIFQLKKMGIGTIQVLQN